MKIKLKITVQSAHEKLTVLLLKFRIEFSIQNVSQQLQQAVDAYDDLRNQKQGQQKYALTHVRRYASAVISNLHETTFGQT